MSPVLSRSVVRAVVPGGTRNLERAGVPRSTAMKITGSKTESVYRRYAIVCERDVAEGLERLGAFLGS